MTVAIIPARGGSKRLPRKNVLPILGEPILSYPIKAALESKLFDSVIVSTEDAEIARAARMSGAQVIHRPAQLAGDRTTVVEVCLQVLEVLENENRRPNFFCCIYATALFIKPDDLRESVKLLDAAPKSDFVMGVTEYNLYPVQALIKNGCYLMPMWPEYHGTQGQFQPHLVASNGTLYWARVSAFRDGQSFYGKRLKGYFIPKERSVDIDTPEDLKIARMYAAHLLPGEPQ
ncbi:MAG: acylneuraminate cytidylyltransferase family protein [Desulfobacterales bacterium]|jgi:N-acylneuraminate cytidylyltransferase